jgi:hypothetical protein
VSLRTLSQALCVYIQNHILSQHQKINVKSRQSLWASNLNCSTLTHCQYMAPFSETGKKCVRKSQTINSVQFWHITISTHKFGFWNSYYPFSLWLKVFVLATTISPQYKCNYCLHTQILVSQIGFCDGSNNYNMHGCNFEHSIFKDRTKILKNVRITDNVQGTY